MNSGREAESRITYNLQFLMKGNTPSFPALDAVKKKTEVWLSEYESSTTSSLSLCQNSEEELSLNEYLYKPGLRSIIPTKINELNERTTGFSVTPELFLPQEINNKEERKNIK